MTPANREDIIDLRRRNAYARGFARQTGRAGTASALIQAFTLALAILTVSPQTSFAQSREPSVGLNEPGPSRVNGSTDSQSRRFMDLLFGEQTRMPVRPEHASNGHGPIVRDGPAGLQGFLWDFGRSNDTDHNEWPDGWGRREGRGYPSYVKIELAAKDEDLQKALERLDAWLLGRTGYIETWRWARDYVPWMFLLQPLTADLPTLINRLATKPVLTPLPPTLPDFVLDTFLRIQMDGGMAEVWSTALPINRTYQYRFRCRVMTDGLRHDSAVAELVFLDQDDAEVAVHAIDPVGGTTPWTTHQIDRIRPPETAVRMFVRLRVEGSGDGLQDIRGEIGFDDIELEQFPQLRIATDRPRGVYWRDQPVEVTARVMGLSRSTFDVRFRLLDQDDRVLATQAIRIVDGAPVRAEALKITSKRDDMLINWSPPRLEPGFYRFTASIEEGSLSSLASVTTIAVIDRLADGLPHGPYGWTLADMTKEMDGEQKWSPDEIAAWLQSLGVAWVKVPCWLAPDDLAGAEKLTVLFRKLEDAGIESVGLLDVPPKSELPMYDLRGEDDEVAALLFRDEKVWRRRLESIMPRLTLKCRTWQLGADRDHSFLGRPNLRESIKQISGGLQGFGQPIDLALSWPWLEQELPPEESSWQANCRSADTPFSADELDQYLSLNESRPGGGLATWLLLDPIDRRTYRREDRIRDLVLRMATVRRHRVESAFVSRPQDPQQGVLESDGRPGELLLPWRTTARLLGNRRYMGALDLRSGAKGDVFGSDDDAVMLVWSDQPTVERIFLGDDVRHVDVWGRSKPLRVDYSGPHPVHEIPIGREPAFLVGLDPTLIAFRMSVQMQPDQLDSLLGETQSVGVRFSNPTNVSLLGTLDFRAPQSWLVDSQMRPWETLPGKQGFQRFDVILGNNATVGTHDIPLVFQFQTAPPRTITVHRNLRVGPDGLELNAVSRMVGDEMLVRLELTNSGSRTRTYQFILFPRNGRQDKRLIVSVEPGRTEKRYFGFVDGEELIGQTMWLRAVEQDSDRVLNYTILGQR